MDNLIKSPVEKFPVYFNFSSDMLSSESISTKTVTCINSSTGVTSKTTIIDSETISDQEVIVVLKSGTEGQEHSIQCAITTSLGNIYQRDLLLVIQTVVDDSFSKQPSDAFMYEVDFTRRLESGDTVASGVVLATKESDGTDVSASVAPSVETLTPKLGVHVAAGTDGETYLLGTRATTAAGYVYEKNIRMNVQEQP